MITLPKTIPTVWLSNWTTTTEISRSCSLHIRHSPNKEDPPKRQWPHHYTLLGEIPVRFHIYTQVAVELPASSTSSSTGLPSHLPDRTRTSFLHPNLAPQNHLVSNTRSPPLPRTPKCDLRRAVIESATAQMSRKPLPPRP